MKSITDYENVYDAVTEFETALAEFTGAPGVVAVGSITQAIELGVQFAPPSMYASLPENVPLSVPMVLKKLGISFMFNDDDDSKWEDRYHIGGTIVYDCRRIFAKDMFESHPAKREIWCLDFSYEGPLAIGHGAAILTNVKEIHDTLKIAVNNGWNREKYPSVVDQKEFVQGYDYCMSPADAIQGLNKLEKNEFAVLKGKGFSQYPSLAEIDFTK